MAEDGYTTITNIDISKVCVEQMIKKTGDRAGFECAFVLLILTDNPSSDPFFFFNNYSLSS